MSFLLGNGGRVATRSVDFTVTSNILLADFTPYLTADVVKFSGVSVTVIDSCGNTRTTDNLQVHLTYTGVPYISSIGCSP